MGLEEARIVQTLKFQGGKAPSTFVPGIVPSKVRAGADMCIRTYNTPVRDAWIGPEDRIHFQCAPMQPYAKIHILLVSSWSAALSAGASLRSS